MINLKKIPRAFTLVKKPVRKYSMKYFRIAVSIDGIPRLFISRGRTEDNASERLFEKLERGIYGYIRPGVYMEEMFRVLLPGGSEDWKCGEMNGVSVSAYAPKKGETRFS